MASSRSKSISGRPSARWICAGLADEVGAVLAGSGAIISALGIYGNPLEGDPAAQETIRGWEQLHRSRALFGTDLVCGFAGRLRGKPVPESLPRFKAVFGELVRRAADQGVRLAFENCWMGGTWQSGDWNIALSPDAWELMFDALPAAHLGLEWEPCHQLCELIDPLPQLRTWVPKIFHVHGKDATVYWDVIRRHGVQGTASRPRITVIPASATATGPTSSASCAATDSRAASTSRAGTIRSTGTPSR